MSKKRKCFKKVILFLVLAITILQSNNILIYASDDIKIKYDGIIYTGRTAKIRLNGQEIKTGEMPGVLVNSRVLVPAREVFEDMGAKVEWNGDKQEVYVLLNDIDIKLTINSDKAYVTSNGTVKKYNLDVPAKLIQDISKTNSKTMIPIRFVSEALGFIVDWDSKNYEVIIKSNAETETQTEDSEQINDEKPLPTALKNNPIMWVASDDIVNKYMSTYSNNDSETKDESHDIVKIKNITYKQVDGGNQFIINADGAISSIKNTIWENKYIIDIVNAENAMLSTYDYANENLLIKEVRSSQYSKEPMTTRVVFEPVCSGIRKDVSVSNDRKSIIVTFYNNLIKEVEINQNDKGDYISIEGLDFAPQTNIFRLSNPCRLVIDMPNTISALNYKTINVEGQYINNVATSQFNSSTVRVVLTLSELVNYQLTEYTNITKIQIVKPRYENINYSSEKQTKIIFKKPNNVKLSNLITNDLYLKKQFTIEIPGNNLSLYGTGDILIEDDLIKQAKFSLNSKGNTVLTIDSNKICAYKIIEDGDNFVINIYKPKDLYSKIIVIDAGHGGKDPGAVGNGLKEKDINLDMVKYLKQLMDKNKDIKAYYTRLDDSFPSLKDRCDLANEIEADIFLSVHNNSFTSNLNGTETCYFKTSDVPTVTSYKFAKELQNQLVSKLKLKNRGLKARNELYVLRNTNMPAALVEVGFVSSPIDSVSLKKDSFRKNAASALYTAIVDTFKKYPISR